MLIDSRKDCKDTKVANYEEALEVEMCIEEPKMYHVLLHNDDYTTMDFVVEVLESIFHKSQSEAMAIMLEIHEKGEAICGTYSHEIAKTKVHHVTRLAKAEGFPLRSSLREAR